MTGIAHRIVVLDWDGTIAHSELVTAGELEGQLILPQVTPATTETMRKREAGRIKCDRNGARGETAIYLRPGIKEVIKDLTSEYRLILWSFGVSQYVKQCLDTTGLRSCFSGVRDRQRTPQVVERMFVKDLSAIDPTLKNIVLVDDASDVFSILNPYNCIDAPQWKPSYQEDRFAQSLPQLIRYHFEAILDPMRSEDLIRLRNIVIERLRPSSPVQVVARNQGP